MRGTVKLAFEKKANKICSVYCVLYSLLYTSCFSNLTCLYVYPIHVNDLTYTAVRELENVK